MNLKQFLLNKVIGESVELAQAASKTIEHGEDDYSPKERKTYIEHFRHEFNDVQSATHLYLHLIGWLDENRTELLKPLGRSLTSNEYMHDPKTVKILWFVIRANNKGHLNLEEGERIWLASQSSHLSNALDELTIKMEAEFGLTPFK